MSARALVIDGVTHIPAYPALITKVQEVYKAQYVMTSALKASLSGWTDRCWDIYWQPVKPDTAESHYFGIRRNHLGEVVITGAKSLEEFPISVGWCTKTGMRRYSQDRHDYVVLPDGNFIDGGRDYTRSSGTIMETRFVHDGVLRTFMDTARFLETHKEEVPQYHIKGLAIRDAVRLGNLDLFYVEANFPKLSRWNSFADHKNMIDWLEANMPDDYYWTVSNIHFTDEEHLLLFKIQFP